MGAEQRQPILLNLAKSFWRDEPASVVRLTSEVLAAGEGIENTDRGQFQLWRALAWPSWIRSRASKR